MSNTLLKSDVFHQRLTNADLKISRNVCIHIETILREFRILNPRTS